MWNYDNYKQYHNFLIFSHQVLGDFVEQARDILDDRNMDKSCLAQFHKKIDDISSVLNFIEGNFGFGENPFEMDIRQKASTLYYYKFNTAGYQTIFSVLSGAPILTPEFLSVVSRNDYGWDTLPLSTLSWQDHPMGNLFKIFENEMNNSGLLYAEMEDWLETVNKNSVFLGFAPCIVESDDSLGNPHWIVADVYPGGELSLHKEKNTSPGMRR